MISPARLMGMLVLSGLILGAAAAPAAQDPKDKQDTVKDRDAFLPKRKFVPLPGKATGILVGGGQDLLKTEGRLGPGGSLCFSYGDGSYRWVYVPVKKKPQIGALNVPVGPKPGEVKRFNHLSVANLENCAQFGVKKPNVLVEVEVNGGLGSPPGEAFVATGMRVLENSKEFPFDTDELIALVRSRYDAYLAGKSKDIEKALQEMQAKSLGSARPTGPREQSELVFVSWLPESQRMLVRIKTQITNGSYKTATVKENYLVLGDATPKVREKEVRYGKSFGVELGMGYELSKKGQVERSQVLPLQAFQKELPPPEKWTEKN